MYSTVDKDRIVFRLKCSGWVDGRQRAAAQEQLRMRLEPGVARQLRPAPATAAAAGPPLPHIAGKGCRTCRFPPAGTAWQKTMRSDAGRAAGSLYSFSTVCEMSGDVHVAGLCPAVKVFLGQTILAFGTIPCA